MAMPWCEVTSALQNPQVASNNRPGYLPQQIENPRVDLGISQLPAAKVPGVSNVPAKAPFIAKASGISQAKQWNPGQVQMLAQQRWIQSQMSGQNQQLQQQYQQRQRQLQQPPAMLKQQPQPLPQQPQQSQGHSHGPGTHGPLQGTQLVKFGRDGKGLNCAELLCKDGLGHTCKHCRPGSPEGEETEVVQSSRRVMLHGSQQTIWMQRLTSQSPIMHAEVGITSVKQDQQTQVPLRTFCLLLLVLPLEGANIQYTYGIWAHMRAGCVFALIFLLIHILKDILRDLHLTSFIQLPNDTSQALLETFLWWCDDGGKTWSRGRGRRSPLCGVPGISDSWPWKAQRLYNIMAHDSHGIRTLMTYTLQPSKMWMGAHGLEVWQAS